MTSSLWKDTTLMVCEVSTGQSFSMGPLEPLFEASDITGDTAYDVATDGQLVLLALKNLDPPAPFEREAKTISSLNHGRVISAQDDDEEDDLDDAEDDDDEDENAEENDADDYRPGWSPGWSD